MSVVAVTDADEGPVYVAGEDAAYFTSVPNGTTAIKRVHLGSGRVSVVVADANAASRRRHRPLPPARVQRATFDVEF